jgi:predicted DNA-binding protein YlxM (UPF0122 family)
MAKTVQLEVLPPTNKAKASNAHAFDESLSQEAERILYDGMPTRDKVWTLHIIEGWSLMDIARSQGVSYQAVWQHWQSIEAELAAAPPDNDAHKRRSILRTRLEAQYAKASKITDPERRIVLCLKTLEVMAKLDGLNIEAQSDEGQKNAPYGTPPEVAAEVKRLMLERWGRPT